MLLLSFWNPIPRDLSFYYTVKRFCFRLYRYDGLTPREPYDLIIGTIDLLMDHYMERYDLLMDHYMELAFHYGESFLTDLQDINGLFYTSGRQCLSVKAIL